MKQNTIALLAAILFLSSAYTFVNLEDQDQHFTAISKRNYVLAVFHNPKVMSKATNHLKSILSSLSDLPTVKDNGFVLEFIDIAELLFFDSHYSLEGKEAVRLFIKGQMVDMQDYDKEVELLNKDLSSEGSLLNMISDFLTRQLSSISKEIANIGEFRDMILAKRIIGFYSGSNNINFKRYFNVARKNIDFSFIHTFDPELKKLIYQELGQRDVPVGDIFAIIRHSGKLNEFDDQILKTFSDFDERPLTEFINYERFDKLRGSEYGNDIFQRMLHKSEVLVLFVNKDERESFKLQKYKSAVKSLPKTFIYSYVDMISPYVGAYHHMFVLAKKTMIPDTVSVMWITPMRKLEIVQFQGEFEKQAIIDFITKVSKENEAIWYEMRRHLYGFDTDPETSDIQTEEL